MFYAFKIGQKMMFVDWGYEPRAAATSREGLPRPIRFRRWLPERHSDTIENPRRGLGCACVDPDKPNGSQTIPNPILTCLYNRYSKIKP